MIEHFRNLREVLISKYRASTSASHSVVTGTLREGFIRTILEGHLGKSISWSTGQMCGYAPENIKSGQLDIILHSGALPQYNIFDHFTRIIPSDAAIGTLEVKSVIQTGKDKGESLKKALESMVLAKAVPRRGGNILHTPLPFYIVGFNSQVSPQAIIDHVERFLISRRLNPAIYWPDAIVVLAGLTKGHTEGFGIFRASCSVALPRSASPIALRPQMVVSPVAGVPVFHHNFPHLFFVAGHTAFAVLVATLANSSLSFKPDSFNLEDYLYATHEP